MHMTHPPFAGRLEDRRFLTGAGRYVDDITLGRQCHMALVLSTHAHAEIRGINTAAAEAMPGVIAVLTGADVLADGLGPVPPFFMPKLWGGPEGYATLRPILATDRARCVGDRLAIVLAETRDDARLAADAVEVDYVPLPAVTRAREALAESAPVLWADNAAGNLSCTLTMGNPEATARAFAVADLTLRRHFDSPRVAPSSLEPRGCIGDYEAAEDRFTLYTSSQDPHGFRSVIARNVLKIAESRLRVVSPDVGGGFGLKAHMHPEDALILWASRRVGRPVKWIATRSEALLTDTQGRGQEVEAEIALARDGRVLGVRMEAWHNLGAYFWGTATPPIFFSLQLVPNTYAIPAVDLRSHAVFTNIAPMSVYRGAGRPEATFQVERVIDKAARELGVDPVELRRQNFITEFPYQTPVAVVYDTGDYNATMDKMLELMDRDGFAARRKASEARGRLRGFGMNCFIEACGIAPSNLVGQLGARAGLYDAATVRVNATGTISVMVGAHSHGQGHETAFPQVVADMLGIDESMIDIVHGDTSKIPFSMGTYGSRSIAVCGSAMVRATEKIIAKAKKIAAHLMEASEADIELKDGAFSVAGTDKSVAWGDVTLAAYVPHNYPLDDIEPGLEETAFYDPANFTYPSGCYICEVEVDPDTGRVEVQSFAAADDFGNVINPMIVEGQVQGGVGQGIGQALLENCVYDADGQLLSASYMDYAMPRASDLPMIDVDHSCQTPCTHNPLGVKGCGEAGAIGSPPAVVNAVIDALQSGGKDVGHIDMPVSPARVWAAMNG